MIEINKIKGKNMKNLDGMSVYLAGAIDRAPDDGVAWRKSIIQKSIERGLKLQWFDPCNKPKSLGNDIPGEIGEEKRKVKQFKKEGQWEKAKEIVHKYRRYDLRMVDTRDFIIAKIDPDIHLCGTYQEIFLAEQQHKPILAIMDKPFCEIPDWLMDVIRKEELFNGVNDCVNYLVKVNNGEISMDDRWVKLLI